MAHNSSTGTVSAVLLYHSDRHTAGGACCSVPLGLACMGAGLAELLQRASTSHVVLRSAGACHDLFVGTILAGTSLVMFALV
eukprot:2880964-Alexandrium_andersonii.AAC.1